MTRACLAVVCSPAGFRHALTGSLIALTTLIVLAIFPAGLSALTCQFPATEPPPAIVIPQEELHQAAIATIKVESAAPASAQPTTETSPVSLDFLSTGTAPASLAELKAMQDRVREVSERVFAATVNIQVESAQGTGVIVSEDGVVLTAAHVIVRPGSQAKVVLQDGTKLDALALGINRDVDSGMLQIKLSENDKRKLPWIDLGQSSSLKPGAWVVAIGHPGGLDPRRGMVVRVGRMLYSNDSLMRTDCSLVGGDSGGPLVDMDGNLIGIHSRIGGTLWENIHVPVDTFSADWDQLADSEIIGGSPNPTIGVELKPDSAEIVRLTERGPSDKAGLKIGDRIVKIKDRTINAREDVSRAIRRTKVGEMIDIVVQRDGAEMTLKLKVGNR